ncbi:hypothetical protein GCK72_008240 [Caenorhabditis remanei]|uniref:F-box domain-containing protein n=1 Tax=Caenorhabditis remanei TaxID=31234 RepID=A0A6A5GZH8_CAERE|nr:hypothetical protein GCK72_008240 [Caenorhabditis remanei]KAF1759995.1 hypothetical protein GCK72_008240 [Caenorhabditis remanei]
MPDPPSNSPIDLRAHVLYDNYQRISAEKSYENYEKLCEAIGNEAISIEEYESLYNQYLEEDERDLPMPDVRGCILSDVICGKSAEKSIDDLCEAFKDHKIDKEDHEYWYKRFENGHIFNRVVFTDFPEGVFGEIVEKCDIKSYLNLRNVSHGLRIAIDQLTPPCNHIHIIFNNMEVDCAEVYVDRVIAKGVLGVLEPLLRNRKLRLKDFWFHTISGFEGAHFLCTKTVINLLNSLDHKIHVENFWISAEPKDLMDILRCLKPGTLEQINIAGRCKNYDINEIAQMDQWKQAKHLELSVVGNGFPPMDHFLHFSTIEFSGSITLPDIVNLCKSVSKWPNFEHIEIDNEEGLNKEEVKRVLNLQPTASPEVYTIPNSNLFIQFERGNSEMLKICKN